MKTPSLRDFTWKHHPQALDKIKCFWGWIFIRNYKTSIWFVFIECLEFKKRGIDTTWMVQTQVWILQEDLEEEW